METKTWKSVPTERLPAWRRAFEERTSGHALQGTCLVCGEATLHRYYSRGPALDTPRAGFVARGALWEWCYSCYTFEHASALVPDGWVGDLEVAAHALSAVASRRSAAQRDP